MRFKFTIALLASSFSAAAFAAGSDLSGTTGPESTSAPAQFQQLDTNNDGNLTKDELSSEPAMKENWTQIETNKDEIIDRAEFSMFEAQHKSGGGMEGNTNTRDY
jgi:hypothetical protein